MKQHNRVCITCGINFISSRSHTNYCKRLCYRRNPINKQKYYDKTAIYQKAHSKELERRFGKLKNKCKHQEIPISILLEEYIELINKGCNYCFKALTEETGCALDRIEPIKGYTIDNVVPCCGACNQIRNVHLTHEEMKVAMKTILEYRKMLGENNV